MAQFSTAIADLFDGTWLNQAASAVDIYLSIVPDTPGAIGSGDDTDYAESVSAPVNTPYAFDLSTIEDPAVSTGHIVRWRRAKDAAGGATIGLVIELRQGYTGEGAQGTLINTFTDAALSDVIATTTDTLSAGEADSITNYADLQGRFVANQT